MGYHIDLSKITIKDYKTKLLSAYLPPSRMILKERLDERFAYFMSIGIKNVKELILLLKKKEGFDELQKINIFSYEYLKILLRELNSTLPKPNRISEFPGIYKNTVSQLEQIGIKNTMKLYNEITNENRRQKLATITGLSNTEILKLTRLTDLSRIKWVGVTLARILYDLEFDSVEKVAKANYSDLHFKINQLNRERNYYKAQI